MESNFAIGNITKPSLIHIDFENGSALLILGKTIIDLRNVDFSEIKQIEINGNIYKKENKMTDKEKQIEDKILVELPCPIGAPIWNIDFTKEDPCAWCEHDHSGFGDIICDCYKTEYPSVEDWLNGDKVCPQFEISYWETNFKWRDMERLKWLGVTWFTSKDQALNMVAALSEKWNKEKQKSDS